MMSLALFIQKIRYSMNMDKPYYVYRLASNLVKRRYLGKFPLRGVDFAIDFSCNFNCEHCFNKTMLNGERKMDLNDYARVIKEAIDLGAINFAFQGGEIFAISNFDDILRLVDSKRFSLAITTNGYLLDEKRVAKLKRLRVNTVAVSLDSGLAEEHDAFRVHKDAFARATKGIELLIVAKIKVVINSCVTPSSLRSEGFLRLLDYARDNKVLLNTIFATPSGKWVNNDKIVLSDEDIEYYKRLVHNNRFVVRDLDAGYAVRGCQGGVESIYVTPYGDVLPCPYIHIRAGNIFNEDLKTIRERSMKYFFYQKRCLIAENHDFIKQYIDVTRSNRQLPLPEASLNEINAWQDN